MPRVVTRVTLPPNHRIDPDLVRLYTNEEFQRLMGLFDPKPKKKPETEVEFLDAFKNNFKNGV